MVEKVKESKEKVVKKYGQVLIIKCEKCGTISESTGPCVKCNNLTFLRVYKVTEV